jgi:GT2 family glycosyltransferase
MPRLMALLRQVRAFFGAGPGSNDACLNRRRACNDLAQEGADLTEPTSGHTDKKLLSSARKQSMPLPGPRLSVVILTYNRQDELRRTLQHMCALPEQPPIIVVDNASSDGTADMVHTEFPQVRLIASPGNIGGAGRNLGVQAADTPYVAFADDDSWWEPGALPAAADLLDAHPSVAAVCSRILLGEQRREDPICAMMANSPLPADGLPGPALLGFVACAVVFRRQAYLDAGGYEPRFFVGGEEALLTLDLVEAGWRIVYAGHLVAHHHPSPQRDRQDRHRVVARNALWLAWLRLPWHTALRDSLRMLRYAAAHGVLLAALRSAMLETPWVLRNRRVVSERVHGWYKLLNQPSSADGAAG